jgi:hypothetical protein
MLPLFFFPPHKYDFRKQLQRILTNDKTADVVKTLLLKAKAGGVGERGETGFPKQHWGWNPWLR